MNIFEFELRYRAYKGLGYKFDLQRDENTIINLVKISHRGILTKKVQEITPEELHQITEETFTKYKKDFIEECGSTKLKSQLGEFDLKTYIERLEYELKVIKEMGFNTYFLIVADFIRRSKKNMIVVGPGRGSGAGSLLARVTRITDVNPLPFGLLFERFLNPARVNMPDFDIDFEDELREDVIKYVTNKYGYDKVCAIGTYMKMAKKAAFKDAARTLGLSFDKSNYFSNLMPDDISITDALNKKDGNEELKQAYEGDKKIQEAVKFGEKLEGNLRQLGVHACGIIISPEITTKYTGLQYIKDDKNLGLVSQFDGPTLENIGLLKMDFLGLRNLSVIKNCIKIITKKHKSENKEIPQIFEEFNKDTSFQPDLEDKETYQKVFQTGNTTGIFQFESEGMRRFLVQLKADSINDLVAMNALYRPGPMEFIPTYIKRKHKEEEVSYMQKELKDELMSKYGEEITKEEEEKLVKDLDPIMNITYGIAVYQEQLMFLVQAMAGFSLAEADLLRRGVGKKKKELIEQLKKEFIEKGANHRNYKPETTKFIYEKMIEPAASYSFNKSHSVCYSLIAYQTAYLKAHFPVEFYASLIRSVEQNIDEIGNYIYEAKSQGIEVLPPHISTSYNHVAAIDNKIRLGFLGIKGIGFEVGEYIQEERKTNGNFKSLEDFLKRCHKIINKKTIESLCKAGALDDFGDRNTIINNTEQLIERSKSSLTMSMGLFGMDEMSQKITFKTTYSTTLNEQLEMEYEVFKCFVSANPLDGLYLYLKKYNFISQIKSTENFGNFTIIGFVKNIQRARKKGFFVQIEDISGQIEFFVSDILNIKKLDLLIISGFKGKNPSIEKITKTNRDILIKYAGDKYDTKYTVGEVKKIRANEGITNIEELIELKKTEELIEPEELEKLEELEELIELEKTEEPEESEEIIKSEETINNTHTFIIPENIELIKEISKIIKEKTGNIKINLQGEKILKFNINEDGLQKIKNIL